MRIIGIDPGLKATGYGVIEVKGSALFPLEIGTIEPRQKDIIQLRIKKIYDNLEGLLEKYHPEVMVLEKLYSHHKHPTTSTLLGHVRGVICLLSAQKQCTLVEHSVKRIRKAVTGNGNATKMQTQRVVVDVLKIKTAKLPLDTSDALALALGYVHLASREI